MKFDRVLTVNHYHDGPRRGVAELDGAPHIYEAEFDHSGEEYGDTYFLSPIERALLALVLEDWAIRRRWEAAFARGETTRESHPALPVDRRRQEVLVREIGDRLRIDPEHCRYFRGRFARRPSGLWVEWQPLGLG